MQSEEMTAATFPVLPESGEFQVRGRAGSGPSATVSDRTIVVTGTWLKLAAVQDEEVLEGDVVDSPEFLIAELRRKRVKADIFTFRQKLTDPVPRFKYPFEWDNFAVIPITTFKDWWENRLPQETRKNVRRAGKRGVVVKAVSFDDELVCGLKSIYDETPTRQGRRFGHYGKDLETIRRENSTFLERSEFLCAYHKDELIGFVRLIYFDQMATIMGIISKNAHYDKRPTNALLAKAVEICVVKGIRYLIYGQFIYGKNKRSALTEFKRRNGFEQVMVLTYYVPLTLRGKIAVRLRLQRGIKEVLPEPLVYRLLDLRAWFYNRQAVRPTSQKPHQRRIEIE